MRLIDVPIIPKRWPIIVDNFSKEPLEQIERLRRSQVPLEIPNHLSDDEKVFEFCHNLFDIALIKGVTYKLWIEKMLMLNSGQKDKTDFKTREELIGFYEIFYDWIPILTLNFEPSRGQKSPEWMKKVLLRLQDDGWQPCLLTEDVVSICPPEGMEEKHGFLIHRISWILCVPDPR